MTRAAALLIALLVALGGSAVATQPVPTRLFLVKKPDDRVKKVVWKLREPDSGADVLGDPTADGATLRVRLTPGGDECFTMPPSGWAALGTRGYRYRDTALANGQVKRAQITKMRSGTLVLKVVVSHGGIVPDARGRRGSLRRKRGRGTEPQQHADVPRRQGRRAQPYAISRVNPPRAPRPARSSRRSSCGSETSTETATRGSSAPSNPACADT